MFKSIFFFIGEIIIQIPDIWNSIKQNKTRNILTGFGIAWGVLILIVLLGVGEGLQRGVMNLFGNYAQNSLWYYGGTTSLAKFNQIQGKKINFTSEIVNNIKIVFPDIDLISPEKKSGVILLSNKNYQSKSSVYGVYPDYFGIKQLNVSYGRRLNKQDQIQMRKVAVIGSKLVDELFSDEDVIGQYIEVNGTWFKVIGVIESGSIFTQQYESAVVITIPLFQECMNVEAHFNTFGLTINNLNNNTKMKIHEYLARRLGFSLNDKKALFISDLEEQTKSFNKLFGMLKLFLWFIGASLLSSGIVGVSNIMFVVVKERTKEIGIRKALGATNKSILLLIILESIVITSVAGLIGMIFGTTIIQVINSIITSTSESSNPLIESININLPVTFLALITIIFAGVIAGIFPARKAASVNPIVAINHDAN